METISWQIIDTYFKDNPRNLVEHHLESYNDFFENGIHRIFRENNPVRFIEREDEDTPSPNECLMYLGGKDGTKIYYGKPVIYDDSHAHFMYPNDARLRNMTYGTTIHYDVEVEMFYKAAEDGERKTHTMLLEKIYLGRFPIMLHSNLCVLKSLPVDIRFNLGECKSDYGGYFIIDGKEKVIIPQEKFADNMVYIRRYKEGELYSCSAEIRSVSEDASKPIRTTGVKLVAPGPNLSNKQIVVTVPNVRKPVPLFILMRALGVVSDKNIIETCLLDLEKNVDYVDYFLPSIHDANKVFNQETALKYISTFTKRRTVNSVLDILMNYLLPHVGTTNLLNKAYFIGNMVQRLLRVYSNEENPTDRDNFRFKRIEQSGRLIYDLFREYYLIQKRAISLAIDNEHYYHRGKYKENFISLVENNYREFFKDRIIETGFKKGFKGNWGSEEHTKRQGVVQDVNRLSWNSFISQMRKLNLPLDASAKVVGPRHLNGSQWGFIDPVDTPDGGNIGLHKHLAISTYITSGFSSKPMIAWMRNNASMKLLQECSNQYLANTTKVIVNGNWVGVLNNPIEIVENMKILRRNGIIPVFTSISFDYMHNEIYIYTDAGRLSRPIYYIEHGKPSFNRKELLNEKLAWQQIVAGFKDKNNPDFDIKNNKLYDASLYNSDMKREDMQKYAAMVDYLDSAEEERSLIAMSADELKKNAHYTHVEIDASLLLGVMGNMIVYPEANPYPRDAFSCGQSKQAVSLYHSNYQMRIDKMGVVLNCGQVPLIKSRYLDYVNKEQQPYGVNAIVAIMSYTGYNVEDAILINEGALKRGLFRTPGAIATNSFFSDVSKQASVVGTKPGYDYSHLDKWGLIKENTPLNDKIVLIGKITGSGESYSDSSVMPKKGQLGFVDKSFITEGEEGFRLAKIRIREERIPAIGDKMASRCGQKGTIGLIIPDEDMPFTADGIRPDLIINPHALPSRMTIGQLVESLFGKVCCNYGGFGDCTAFQTKGSNAKLYGTMLTRAGFHSSGNQLLYNGMTGEQLQSDIFIGPTYYMRLKHMVKDKINYRARGPRTALTRQTVQGRANDGGLRVGEMERDAIISHGASHFLHESFLVRGDEYYMAVCNKTGVIAIYNKNKNILLSPSVDGPVKFHTTMDGKMNMEMISKYGRSFSILRIPYSLKLLIQELQVMNIQMRIITDKNVEQLMSMSYSDNIIKVTDKELQVASTQPPYTDTLVTYLNKYTTELNRLAINAESKKSKEAAAAAVVPEDSSSSSEIYVLQSQKSTPSASSYDMPYVPYSPPNQSPVASASDSSSDVPYAPYSPYQSSASNSPIVLDIQQQQQQQPQNINFGDEELNIFYMTLPRSNQEQLIPLSMSDRIMLLKMLMEKKKSAESILESTPESESSSSAGDKSESASASASASASESGRSSMKGGETKSIIMNDNNNGGGGGMTKSVSFTV